ncbi:hypothetical protein D3C78_1521720 [compost metagenome]
MGKVFAEPHQQFPDALAFAARQHRDVHEQQLVVFQAHHQCPDNVRVPGEDVGLEISHDLPIVIQHGRRLLADPGDVGRVGLVDQCRDGVGVRKSRLANCFH